MTHIDRPSAPRLAPVTDPSPEVREIMGKGLMRDGKPINIFGTIAHHPRLMKRFNVLGGLFLVKGLVPAREREIVILRVGWKARAVYEFGQHTEIGREVGLTDDEIAALARTDPGTGWTEDERALIAMADELCDDDCVSDHTWAALRRRWDDDELVELVMVAGFYRMVSGFLNTMGVQLDDGVPGWPAS